METIINKNAPDNASCPRCTHYNAMLGTGNYVTDERGRREIHKCRDCGFQAFVEKEKK